MLVAGLCCAEALAFAVNQYESTSMLGTTSGIYVTIFMNAGKCGRLRMLTEMIYSHIPRNPVGLVASQLSGDTLSAGGVCMMLASKAIQGSALLCFASSKWCQDKTRQAVTML